MPAKQAKGLVIDGVAASEAIDSSGEIMDIKGCDITTLKEGRGVANYEHKDAKEEGAGWNDIVGRITYAKKIFTQDDCANERERLYFKKTNGLPYIYIKVELFDAEGHPGAVALAAIVRHYHNRELPILVQFSIEGSTLEKEGQTLKRTIAKGVATTIKPCNKTAFSGILEDPKEEKTVQKDALQELLRSEGVGTRRFGSMEIEVDPVVDESPVELLKNSVEKLKWIRDLRKTLTAGITDAAPSTLTGGAALQREDLKRHKYIKSQISAAVRDWKGTGDFKKFLKARLPDVHESYIDHFENVVHEFQVKKAKALAADLAKALSRHDDWLGDVMGDSAIMTTMAQGMLVWNELRKTIPATEHPRPTKPEVDAGKNYEFNGQHVIPGEVTFISGNLKGQKLPYVGREQGKVFLLAPEGGLKQVPEEHENRFFRIAREPQPISVPQPLDSRKHGHPLYNRYDEQHQLLQGIDLEHEGLFAPMGTKPGATKGARWLQNSAGEHVFVKPQLDERWLPNKEYEGYNTAHNEALFHNIARDVFGLGAYVPTTAVFNDPKTGDPWSAMRRVQGRHLELYQANKNMVLPRAGSLPSQSLLAAGDRGDLHKLAILDQVMGNWDRNASNFMTSNQFPHIHLIDNALLHGPPNIPSYVTYYHTLKDGSHPFLSDDAWVHPEAAEYARKLDPPAIGRYLADYGVPRKQIKDAVKRAFLIRQNAMRPNVTVRELFNMKAPYDRKDPLLEWRVK